MKQAPRKYANYIPIRELHSKERQLSPSRCMQSFVRTLQSVMMSIENAGMCFVMKMCIMY